MLDRCAKGYGVKKRTHNYCITWGGKTYPSLPLGRHGKRKNLGIQIGHVKKMCRHLGIYDCAAEHFSL